METSRALCRTYILLFITTLVQIDPGWSNNQGMHWTEWTAWSECSRSCDGGAAYQMRHCKDAGPGACAGENIRYRTCNNQPCPGHRQDFRAQQCQAYDDVPYREKLYEWVPYHDVNNLCVLRCTAHGHGFSVIQAPKVLDGTRCQPDSRDMCINGKCRVVGCDDTLGSDKKPDVCGVCGGDGTTCSSRHPGTGGRNVPDVYVWEVTDFGRCSSPCGVGVQSTRVVCRERSTGNIVHTSYCHQGDKPETTSRTCTRQSCRPVWITAEWQPCPVSCGRGIARRTAYCVREAAAGGFRRTEESLCTDVRPATEKYCNEFQCPVWIAGDWAPCPVTCGRGRQHREAICRRTIEHDCSRDQKPMTTRPCDTGVICEKDKETVGKTLDPVLADPNQRAPLGSRPTVHFVDQTPEPQPQSTRTDTDSPKVFYFQQADRASFVPPPIQHAEAQEYGNPQGNHVIDVAGGPAEYPDVWVGSGIGPGFDHSASLEADRNQQNRVSSTPSFVASHWSTCSATCGVGLRNRRVVCKVYLEFADVVQNLPDSECQGTKPPETEVCKSDSCDDVSPLDQRDMYIWRFTGYGQCSASCLGGTQAAQFACVRIGDFSVISSVQCQDVHLPDNKPKPCNMVPCPPEWQITRVGSCSRRCGGGHQYQRVQCTQRHGKEPYDYHEVSVTRCTSDKKPLSEVECNIMPCPPAWSARPWSECTTSCGNGTQHREIVCEQRVGPDQSELLPDEFCNGTKPFKFQYCNLPRCPKRSKEYIVSDTSWLVQLTPLKKLYIDVGGRVTIIPRTSVKIKCPVRKISRKVIVWRRNGVLVPYSGRLRRSRKKGVLLLRKSRLSDSGVYTCTAGNATDSIVIDFHSKEEANKKRQQRASLLKLRYGDNISEPTAADEYRASLMVIEKEVKHISALPFHYVTEAWSACTKSCGGAGLQSRPITCDLVYPHYYFIVPDKLCTNRGQEKPVNTRDCGYQKCPHWQHGEWSQCSDNFCVRSNVASRKRNLICVTQNATLVPTSMCDPLTRPNDTIECPNNRCYATWHTSDWSECSKTCGGKGIKTRTLSCVWYATKTPAGASCRHIHRRPAVVKDCISTEPCDTGRCRDLSKYCSLVTRLNFCRYKQYHEECCQSCRNHDQQMEKQRRRRRRRRRKYDQLL